jgi:hypothetical protein
MTLLLKGACHQIFSLSLNEAYERIKEYKLWFFFLNILVLY